MLTLQGISTVPGTQKMSEIYLNNLRTPMSYMIATRSVWPLMVLSIGFRFCLEKKICFKTQKPTDVSQAAHNTVKSPHKDQKRQVQLHMGRN